MIDFDAAVAAVQDPNADPVLLAKIAYENPEFGANVVANPRAYPGLKRWVAEFGDERARQQLVAMGWPVPQEGVQPQEEADAVAQQQAASLQRHVRLCRGLVVYHRAVRAVGRDGVEAVLQKLLALRTQLMEQRGG